MLATGQRRFLSTGPQPTFIVMKKANSKSFKKDWLSDPSTYPLLVSLGGAVFMAFGFGINYLVRSPDVRVSHAKKHATVRNW